LDGRVALVIQPPASNLCGLRGLTKVSSPSISIMADAQTGKRQFLGVLAHEMGHVVELFAY
jgi:hypothetical protein